MGKCWAGISRGTEVRKGRRARVAHARAHERLCDARALRRCGGRRVSALARWAARTLRLKSVTLTFGQSLSLSVVERTKSTQRHGAVSLCMMIARSAVTSRGTSSQ